MRLSRSDPKDLADASLTDPEPHHLVRVLQLADRLGHGLRYHTHDSRRSAPGFPDLALCRERDGRLIFLELKAGRKKPTDAQLRWVVGLNRVERVDAAEVRDATDLTPLENFLR